MRHPRTRSLDPPPSRFALAREFHHGLHTVIDADRMLYVAGYNQATYSGIRDWDKLHSTDGYEVTKRGDGTVPHMLGLLQTADGRPVPTFYIEEEHGALPGNQSVMAPSMNCCRPVRQADCRNRFLLNCGGKRMRPPSKWPAPSSWRSNRRRRHACKSCGTHASCGQGHGGTASRSPSGE